MRLTHKMLLFLALGLCSIGFALSSFQKPQDKIALQKEVERWASQRVLDSLLHYQTLLQEILDEQDDQAPQQASGQRFLSLVLEWEELSAERKRALIEKTPASSAWKKAFLVHYFLKNDQVDSAAVYFEKLERIRENKQALIYANASYARYYSRSNKNWRAAYNYLQKGETASETAADSLLFFPAQTEVYAAIGYFEEAIQAAKRSIKRRLAKKYVDSIALAFSYQELANIYLQNKAYKEAENYSGEAINCMADRANYNRPTASMWYTLATCYYNFENKPSETILYLRKVFSLLENEAETSKDLLLDACHLMALQFLKVNELDSTQLYVNRAQKLQKKHAYKLGQVWFVQGQLDVKRNDRRAAITAFQKAVDALEKEAGPKSIETTNCLLYFGKWLLQEKLYNQAHLQLEKALWSTSTQKGKGNLPDIQSVFSKTLAIQSLSAKIEAMFALYEKSKYNVSLKDIHAHTLYNLELWDAVSQQNDYLGTFLNVSTLVFEQGIEACLLLHSHNKEMNYLHQAFDLGERAKELLLQESLKEPDSKGFGAVPKSLLESETFLLKRKHWYEQAYWKAAMQEDSLQIDWCQAQMTNLEKELEAVRAELATNHSKYTKFRSRGVLADLDSVQMALSDSTVLVQYLEGKNAIFQFVICKDTFAVRKIFWRTYKPTIRKYYKHFTDSKLIQHNPSGGYKDFCLTSYELYHKLLHHELLKGKDRMVIIPDGLMHYVPFGTLLTQLPLDSVHKVDFQHLSFLIKDKNIAYNYSTTVWLKGLNKNKEPINNEILGMGVTYEDQVVPEFRSPKHQDWRNSKGTFLGAQPQMDSFSIKYAGVFYTNRYASEYYLKQYAGSYGILHLATHGIIDQSQPEYSNLMLTEDAYDGEDNFLTTNEIKQLHLKTSMVVLANCETGYGTRQKGEGLLSLGMSFLYAGSPSVVLSLWQQDDQASPQIVDYFYENLKQKMPKDKALRLAKLRYLKSAKGMEGHPSLWAGLVPFGNTKAIEISEPVTHIWWFIFPIAFVGFLGWWSMQALRQRR